MGEYWCPTCDGGFAGENPCSACQCIVELEARIAELEAEVAEWCEEALCYGGSDKDGWICSNALSGVVAAGERLVELGRYERKPDGVGRVQYYRSIKAAKAEQEQDNGG